MRTWRIFKHPGHSASTVVKVGFSWPAFIIGPPWFLLNKMWLAFLLSVAFIYGAPMVLEQFEHPSTQGEAIFFLLLVVIYFGIWFVTGKVANFLLEEELKHNGYELVATVQAKNPQEARETVMRLASPPDFD